MTRKADGPESRRRSLSLGEEHTPLWQQLDDEEIKEVSQAMAASPLPYRRGAGRIRLGHRRVRLADGLYEQTQRLLALLHAGRSRRRPGWRKLIARPGAPWDKLGNERGCVANYLKNEYPQTVAVFVQDR